MDEARRDRLLAMPVGQRTNAFLHDILEPWVLGYWLFQEPKHRGVELSDCLVLWDDVVFLFEAKTRAVPRPASRKWIHNKLVEAASQITERARMLAGREVPQLRNRWRGTLDWDASLYHWYYGIIVLNHFSEPYDPREVAPEIFASQGPPIQVFSLADLAELFRVVTTPPDFMIYYELRAAYADRFRVPVHEESATFEEVLRLWPELAAQKSSPSVPESESRAERDFLLESSRVLLQLPSATEVAARRLAYSFLLDLAIRSIARKADQDALGKHVGSPRHKFFMEAMESAAELSRRRRAHWGEQWFQTAEECASTGQIAQVTGHSPRRRRSYVFCAFPEGQTQREAHLSALAQAAMKRHGSSSAVGFAATGTRIRHMHEVFAGTLLGAGAPDLGDEELLDTLAVYVDPGTS